ncbi:hypothetical protein A2962_02970 [Candidatus Woesebacteria bacterium RIFCSPLOWO2_01_FULL_39_61]|uniref:DUF7282 domain-containing protein n=1 Tax=Candidatus Woesebacteria bacterium RIFCSPHIGHO2_02_FULL_39_13 TaxID=1802505 RepID=A0A1F7Z082_9BACT|nr:MAG: hypothetical protein A2692_04100 [Candidatus Woesebacteria bacterium RIFCSPHIGHO2_01_FULL_39_95]OGM33016.1 MAG: hypothetical protein A3D01_04180 [Candidatus Woesebacteria bacterium RIFCSPHIGHO2_02_FULL_39_13]OGM37875.1 MAG: hypothetical protein A3E13_04075 [Candidatus Woesebacteria bacterium RIFCSPHIGHO2_12_FULL_40_20]OGM66448.1 MAG: hypothetical protein A2962_02970 [Candidatus Woesebacteria bacterium RIFCSPLOWO2_01_FULL_39_61]OGM74811.1 MAG: hypothetical protein A3H19_01740 [Candidatus
MIKRILIIIILGTLLGLAAFLIQVKRGKINLQNAPAETVPEEQTVIPTPTEEEVLQGKISLNVTSISPGDKIILDSVRLILPGFVVLYKDDGGNTDSIIGISGLLQSGDNIRVEIKLNKKLVNGEKVYLGLHSDDGNAAFDGPRKDIPIMTRGAIPVRKEFIVGF